MTNRIPTKAQTYYADSKQKDADDLRVKRNQRRNARQKAARTPFLADRPGMGTMKLAELNTRRRVRARVRRTLGLA